MIPLLLALAAAPSSDRLLEALEHELGRSMRRLVLPPSKKPYYLSYTVQETIRFQAMRRSAR